MTSAFGTEEYAANLALGHLGQPEIASLQGDTTTRARKIRQFFPAARDELQRHKPWNFATAWVAPAMDPMASLGHLKNRFVMPADCLRVRFIKGDNRREWEIESGQGSIGGVPVEASILVTNIDAPTICYTRRITAVRLWDAMFLPAFGYMLAGYCATGLGKSATWGDDMIAKAKDMTSDAAGVDAKERGPQYGRPETSWQRARRGRGFSGRHLRD